VHQRGHDRLHVEPPFGADSGDRDRVRDVRLARRAELAEVCLVGEPVRLADAPDVGSVEVVELAGERGERRRRGIPGRCSVRRCRRRRRRTLLRCTAGAEDRRE
jgi:hypothetical protein